MGTSVPWDFEEKRDLIKIVEASGEWLGWDNVAFQLNRKHKQGRSKGSVKSMFQLLGGKRGRRDKNKDESREVHGPGSHKEDA